MVIMNRMAGRGQELSSLGELLDATMRGSGGCVVVDGPFGIGKTHLLKVTGLEAAARGLTVVAGRASVTDQPVPVHLLVNFLRHAMPGEAAVEQLALPGANPFWLIDRVGDLVEVAARRRPLVVALDDAQRIDDVSALALRGLVPRLASSPVLWLLARRPVAAGSIAQHAVDWLAEHVAVRVRLREPGEEAVADLCAGILGARPDASVLRWAARCGGNPKVMEIVFSAFIKAGQMIIVDGAASVVSDELPDGVLAAVRGLLEELPPPLRRLLAAGGRLGHTFPVDRVTGLLDGSAADVSAAIDEAVRVGLIRRDGAELTFAHPVLGEALRHAAYPEPERAEPGSAPHRRRATRSGAGGPIRGSGRPTPPPAYTSPAPRRRRPRPPRRPAGAALGPVRVRRRGGSRRVPPGERIRRGAAGAGPCAAPAGRGGAGRRGRPPRGGDAPPRPRGGRRGAARARTGTRDAGRRQPPPGGRLPAPDAGPPRRVRAGPRQAGPGARGHHEAPGRRLLRRAGAPAPVAGLRARPAAAVDLAGPGAGRGRSARRGAGGAGHRTTDWRRSPVTPARSRSGAATGPSCWQRPDGWTRHAPRRRRRCEPPTTPGRATAYRRAWSWPT